MLIIAFTLGGCGNTYVLGVSETSQSVDSGPRKAIKPALLRLEDVGPGGPYFVDENLHKLYAIAEYLHQEGIPFHVSLIPRIVVPKKGYDAGMADDTAYSRRFVQTLKDIQNLGGVVGIHGYTHQTGSDPSGWGFEFYDPLENPRAPNTYEFARERIDKSVDLFKKANIIPAYWETPHYTASLKQHPAFEEQAGLIYENKHRGEMAGNYKVIDFPGQGYRGFVTVPAPLGSVERDSDVERIIKKLDHMGNDLASFFYHPFREFKYLYKDYNAKGEVYYVYDQNSPLHVLIRAFKEKGYTFVSVNTLVRFVPAHRLAGLPFGEGDAVVTGRFEDRRESVLVWNRGINQWRMYEYTADWHTPRRIWAFADRGIWLKDWVLENDVVPLVGDFNGDKKDDLMVFSPGPGTFQLAENMGGKFIPMRVSLPLSGVKPDTALAGDFNGDGLCDLAVYERQNERIGISLRTKSGGFRQVRWQGSEMVKADIQRMLVGDFNGDRRDDIVFYDSSGGKWMVMLAGSGGTKLIPSGSWADGRAMMDSGIPFAADFNGDGKCDLVVYGRTGRWLVTASDGKSFNSQQGDYGPWGASQKGVPLVADFNGDGSSDLAIIDGVKGKDYNLDIALSVINR